MLAIQTNDGFFPRRTGQHAKQGLKISSRVIRGAAVFSLTYLAVHALNAATQPPPVQLNCGSLSATNPISKSIVSELTENTMTNRWANFSDLFKLITTSCTYKSSGDQGSATCEFEKLRYGTFLSEKKFPDGQWNPPLKNKPEKPSPDVDKNYHFHKGMARINAKAVCIPTNDKPQGQWVYIDISLNARYSRDSFSPRDVDAIEVDVIEYQRGDWGVLDRRIEKSVVKGTVKTIFDQKKAKHANLYYTPDPDAPHSINVALASEAEMRSHFFSADPDYPFSIRYETTSKPKFKHGGHIRGRISMPKIIHDPFSLDSVSARARWYQEVSIERGSYVENSNEYTEKVTEVNNGTSKTKVDGVFGFKVIFGSFDPKKPRHHCLVSHRYQMTPVNAEFLMPHNLNGVTAEPYLLYAPDSTVLKNFPKCSN